MASQVQRQFLCVLNHLHCSLPFVRRLFGLAVSMAWHLSACMLSKSFHALWEHCVTEHVLRQNVLHA